MCMLLIAKATKQSIYTDPHRKKKKRNAGRKDQEFSKFRVAVEYNNIIMH